MSIKKWTIFISICASIGAIIGVLIGFLNQECNVNIPGFIPGMIAGGLAPFIYNRIKQIVNNHTILDGNNLINTCEEEVNPYDDCPLSGQIYDCNGNCAPDSWVGDGSCDNGSYNFAGNDIFFNCDEFNNDEGDCDALGRTTQQRPYPIGRIKTN